MMHIGYLRFIKQLDTIRSIIRQALATDNPIAFIYKKDLRTPFFMLEGLCRMYRHLHDEKTFKKILKEAKQIEDALGKYDFYYTLYQDIIATPLPEKVKQYVLQTQEQCALDLHQLLEVNDWWNEQKINEWNEILRGLNWMKPKKELEKLQQVYKAATIEVYHFVERSPFPFEDMEEHVHELRRKLRWLSIYAHALDGLVTLYEDVGQTLPEKYQKYYTEKITNSPFTQFVGSLKYKHHLHLNKNSFIALSWMIAEISIAKDKGLALHAIHTIASHIKRFI
jgi:hypothetical protein